MGNESKNIILYEDANTPVVVSGEWAKMAYSLNEQKRARFILTCLGVALDAKGFEGFAGFDDEELQACWERTRIKHPDRRTAREGKLSVTKNGGNGNE